MSDECEISELTRTVVHEGDCILVSDGTVKSSIALADIDPDFIECSYDTIKFLVDKFNKEQADEAGFGLRINKVFDKNHWFDNGRE